MDHRRSGRATLPWIVFAIVLIAIFSRTIAGFLLDYQWWQEMGQVSTWVRMMQYRFIPPMVVWLILWIVFWVAHARGMKYAGTGLREQPVYARLALAGAGLLSLFVASGWVDGLVIARWMNGGDLASNWQDPVFGKPLTFYFFILPFYERLVSLLLVTAAVAALVYYATARAWQVRLRFPHLWQSGQIQWDDIRVLGSLESGLFKIMEIGRAHV